MNRDIMLWGDKPYHSLDYELKLRFKEKIFRLSLDSGCTCPNRDGTLGYGGCIFCSEGGSGDFAGNRFLSVTEQIRQQKALLSGKFRGNRYIAYFQAYTSTYGPVEKLETCFTEAILHEEVVALSIATRPDCLGPDILKLLARLNQIKPVWVELGLQTIHEDTARFIRRGYELPCFEEAVKKLHDIGIEVIVHTILGLPGEDESMNLETMHYLNQANIQGVKLQLLHILRGTDLALLYEKEPFKVFSKEEYIQRVILCLEHLSPGIVIHRVTGDGPKDLMIAPKWSGDKRGVLNELHHQLKLLQTWQGRCVQ